jgi:hypothetical protein
MSWNLGFHKMPHETLSGHEYQVMRMIASEKTVKEKEIGFVGG